MADVFISYRRDDARGDAGRLADRLTEVFGDDHVFMDVDDIDAGDDFAQALEESLARCTVLLAIIGPGWLAAESGGARRLEQPGDYVRIEIERALARDIRVIPVLVGGAELPAAEALPPSLRVLASRQAVRLAHARFHTDVDALLRELDGSPWRRRPRWQHMAIGVLLVATLGALVAWYVTDRAHRSALRAQLDVAQGHAADARHAAAASAYLRALDLDPRSDVAREGVIVQQLEVLSRRAYLESGAAHDVALSARGTALRLVSEAEIDALLSHMYRQSSARSQRHSDLDQAHRLALAMRLSPTRHVRAIEVLIEAGAQAGEHAESAAELGLLRVIAEGDESGIELIEKALPAHPDPARAALYLARARSTLGGCEAFATENRAPPGACASAARDYERAMRSADQSSAWGRHVARSAARSAYSVIRHAVRNGGGIITASIALSPAERLAVLELARERAGTRLASSFDENPGFWIAQLHAAAGRSARAREVLESMLADMSHVPKPWAALLAKLARSEGEQ